MNFQWSQFAVVILACATITSLAGCGSGTMSSSEAAARKGLDALGAMTVKGADGVHVGTLSMVPPKIKGNMDEAIPLVKNLPYLTHVELTGTNVNDEHMKTIASLSRLRSLVLSRTQVGDAGFAHLSRLKLNTLYADDTQITKASMPVISGMTDLTILELSGTNVTSDLGPLAKLEKLEWLVLSDAEIDSVGIAVLKGMKACSRLTLNDCSVSEADLDALRSARPALKIDVNSDGAPVESETAESQSGE